MPGKNKVQIIIEARDMAGSVFREVQRESGRAFRAISSEAGRLKRRLTSLHGTLLTLAGGYGIAQMATSFLNAARATENYQVRLRVLLGSVEEGNRLFKAMSNYASKVPFTYEEIMGAATQLAGVMKGGVDEIKRWMPLIGDLAAASGLSISETTEQVIRMYSAGAAAADLFRERGITAMLGFQQAVHYSAEETRRMLIKAWEDPASKFRGATNELAKTWDGAMSMMADKWFKLRNMVMKAGVYDELKRQMDELNKATGEWIGTHGQEIREWARDMANSIKEMAKGITTIAQYAALRSISETFAEGARLASKSLLDWEKFKKASFIERQRMVDEARSLYGVTGPLHFKMPQMPEKGISSIDQQIDEIRRKLKEESEKWAQEDQEAIKERVNAIASGLKKEEDSYKAFIKEVRRYQQEAIQSIAPKIPNMAEELERALGDPDAYFGPLRDSAKNTFNEITQFAVQAARNMQSAFSDFFFDAMQGNLGDLQHQIKSVIDRMVAEIAAARASHYLFGEYGKTGQIGGFVAEAASWAREVFKFAEGGLITEPVLGIGMSGRRYLFGERGPEEVRPVSHVHKTSNNSITINMNIQTQDADSFELSRARIASQISAAIARAIP